MIARRSAEACWALFCVFVVASCGNSGGSGGRSRPSNPAPGPEVARGPQIGLLDVDSVLVAWHSEVAAPGAVEYGVDPSSMIEAADPTPRTEHVFVLDGLLSGTTYTYRVKLDDDIASDGHTFTTIPLDPEAPFRFAVFGDCGGASVNQRQVAMRVLQASPDLVLITGDVVYDYGREKELDPKYFRPYAQLIDHVPFYPALGNHDIRTQDGRPLLDALYLPRNDADGSERFYAFDRGVVHFVALDSTQAILPGSVQHDWLVKDLERTDSIWIVIYLHHPPYSSSVHGSDLVTRTAFDTLPADTRVDLVFSGHDHDYERTIPIDDTVYVVTGGGGRSLYPNGRSAFTEYSESVYHHVQVDVETDATHSRLSVSALRAEDGSVLDEFVIEKAR